MLTALSNSNVMLLATISFLLMGCGTRAETKVDSGGDPLPPHAIIRLGTLRFLPESNQTDVIQYSHDGAYVATAGFTGTGAMRPQVQIWDRKTGRDVTPMALKKVEATGISWLPKQNRFITSHSAAIGGASLRLWTMGSDRPVCLPRHDPGYVTVHVAPAGGHFAARTEKEEVVVFDLRGREIFRFPFGGKQKSFNVACIIDFSPDGKRLAVVAEKGIELYDLSTHLRTRAVEVSADSISCVRFLPDGESVAIATDKGSRVISLGSPNTPEQRFGDEIVQNVAISPDGRWLLNSAFVMIGRGSVWDLATRKMICDLSSSIDGGIAFAPDNSELAISTRRISFIETGTWNDRPSVNGHDSQIGRGILVGDELWTGEYGPNLRKWNLHNGALVDSIRRVSAGTSALAMTSDSEMAVAGQIPEVDVLNLQNKRLVASVEAHEPYTTTIVYAPQHQRLVTAGPDGLVRGWNYDRESQLFADAFEQAVGIADARIELAISPDGEYFACGNLRWARVTLFRTHDGRRCWDGDMATTLSIMAPVAFTPDSKQLAMLRSYLDGKTREYVHLQSVQFLECATGERLTELDCEAREIISIAISPDGQMAAVGLIRNEDDHEIQIWSIAQNRLITTLTGHFELIRWLSFTPDSKRLISLSDATGLVWDLESYKSEKPFRRPLPKRSQ